MKYPKTVVVLGASDKQERMSNKAVRLLKERGFCVIPVHPHTKCIENIDVTHSLDDIDKKVDILSVYIKSEILEKILPQVIKMHPDKIILNPYTDSPFIEEELKKHNMLYEKACTIVLLNQGKL